MSDFKEELTQAVNVPEKKKKRVASAEIIERTVDGKPYYTIKYFDLEDNCYYEGYGSWWLDYVRKWLDEEFEIVES